MDTLNLEKKGLYKLKDLRLQLAGSAAAVNPAI